MLVASHDAHPRGTRPRADGGSSGTGPGWAPTLPVQAAAAWPRLPRRAARLEVQQTAAQAARPHGSGVRWRGLFAAAPRSQYAADANAQLRVPSPGAGTPLQRAGTCPRVALIRGTRLLLRADSGGAVLTAGRSDCCGANCKRRSWLQAASPHAARRVAARVEGGDRLALNRGGSIALRGLGRRQRLIQMPRACAAPQENSRQAARGAAAARALPPCRQCRPLAHPRRSCSPIKQWQASSAFRLQHPE